MMATPATLLDSAWYPDSGASNQLTPNIHNLSNRSEYGGNDQVYLANGSGTFIKHIGYASLQHSSLPKPLYLNTLLHVPHASKNLISVSKFELVHTDVWGPSHLSHIMDIVISFILLMLFLVSLGFIYLKTNMKFQIYFFNSNI